MGSHEDYCSGEEEEDQEDYYSGEEDYYSGEEDSDIESQSPPASDDDDIEESKSTQNSDGDEENNYDDGSEIVIGNEAYTFLTEADLQRRQQEDVMLVSSMLSISPSSSITLLLHYRWDTSAACEAFLANENKIRTTLGLPSATDSMPEPTESSVLCSICFDEHLLEDMTSTPACNHFYCHTCWLGYISTAIADGSSCLLLRCPHPNCNASVGFDVVHSIVDSDAKDRYQRFLLKSYVEDSNCSIKWCPAAGCNLAIALNRGEVSCEIRCRCSNRHCWGCSEEPHRPVDCDIVSAWLIKNNSEAENTTWILANSKACPSCKRAIEKIDGCMHMSCKCGHHFCWLCLGPWKNHSPDTGGYYVCNIYNASIKLSQEEEIRERAKMAAEKYTHYYERWASNHKSLGKAMASLEDLSDGKLHYLLGHGATAAYVEGVLDAWRQVAECRRILKWTYAYGYYLSDSNDKIDRQRKEFFEYLQGEAESALEKLHHCAEMEMGDFLKDQKDYESFVELRQKLVGLTAVTSNYFDNLVSAIEGGLEDVGQHEAVAPERGGDWYAAETKKKYKKNRRRRKAERNSYVSIRVDQ